VPLRRIRIRIHKTVVPPRGLERRCSRERLVSRPHRAWWAAPLSLWAHWPFVRHGEVALSCVSILHRKAPIAGADRDGAGGVSADSCPGCGLRASARKWGGGLRGTATKGTSCRARKRRWFSGRRDRWATR
jgi:hypothetical protein